MYTFFEENNLSGKRIIPFSTHGGSGFTGTIEEMIRLLPNSSVEKQGLTISRNRISGMEKEVSDVMDGRRYLSTGDVILHDAVPFLK